MKYVVAAVLVFGACLVADASHCVVQNHAVQSYVAPVQAVIPVYGFSYGGTDPALLQILHELKQSNQLLAEQVQAMKSGGAPQADAPHLRVFVARCAKCHEKGSESRGGGFVLLEGGKLPPQMDAAAIMSISYQVATEKMPKGSKLTREESMAIQEWVGAVAAQAKQQAKVPAK